MNVRLKALKKIAQTQTTTPAVPVTGTPAAVSISMFPTVTLGWGSNNTSHIQKFIDTLNMSMYVLSKGKIDFDKMRQQNFNVDLSSYVASLKGIAALAKDFSQKILTNNGVVYKEALKPEEKSAIIGGIRGSATFGTISDGGIDPALPAKIGGNFKTIILNLLNNIK